MRLHPPLNHRSLIEHLQRGHVPSGRIAFIEVETNRSITYAEFWEQVNRLATGLSELGLAPEGKVALVMGNSIDWAISFFAVLKASAIVIPLHHFARPLELKRIVSHLKPSLFIADASVINRSLPFDVVDDGQPVVIRSRELLIRMGASDRVVHLYRLLQRKESDPRLPTTNGHPHSNIASISYTYRGYGYPLGAMLTHENYLCGVKAYIETIGFHENHKFLATLPFSYVYPLVGCLLAPLATGSTTVIVRAPSPKSVWESIDRHKPTILTGVPSSFASLLQARSWRPLNLKVEQAICGGSRLQRSLYEEIQHHWSISLRQGYGLTECLPVTCNPATGNRPETVGKVAQGVSGVEVRVVRSSTAEHARSGETGEIIVTGPTVMHGYYGMPEETAEVIKDGWLCTGDTGWFDSAGYLHFAGLKKRIAKVGGNMVDLKEVEREILNLAGFPCDVKTYSLPDERFGEVVAVDLVNKSDGDNNKVEIKAVRQYLRRRLSSYKIPLVWRVVS